MNGVNKTLYIPLYGKAYVSRKGLFLKDPKAQEIWAAEGFPLKGKSKSKWLAYYMGIRSAVFDDWLREKMGSLPAATVIHLGCGMDSRILRVGTQSHPWYDVDFPAVIDERKRYFAEDAQYHMVPGDAREGAWLEAIPASDTAIVVMEGLSMYLAPGELAGLLNNLSGRFENIALLMDCYTVKAAKVSRFKNPINDVGVTQVYGLDDPKTLEGELTFLREHDMTPQAYIDELTGLEKAIFAKLFAGSFSKSLYRMYEYRK